MPAGHFLGRTLNTRALSGFCLTETVYASGLRLPCHSHGLAKYCFVLAGRFTEAVGHLLHPRQPLTQGKFYDMTFGAAVTFVKDARGAVTHFI